MSANEWTEILTYWPWDDMDEEPHMCLGTACVIRPFTVCGMRVLIINHSRPRAGDQQPLNRRILLQNFKP